MKKLIFFVFALLAAGQSSFGQKTESKNALGIITGNALDNETGKGLDAVTVTAGLLGDSASRNVIVTGVDGGFEFSGLAFGYYRIMLSLTGYKTVTIDSIYLRDERYDFNIGDIKLSNKDEVLQDVIVYVEKPLIENKDGKIVYNVGESALTAGSNTAEILKNMPLVSNDPNGRLLLKGKEPKILIDDKPVDLSAQQLTDLLESLPGGSIERIELMTNPPAQYASEQGGVINIVTRKGRIGMTGKVTLGIGTRGEGNLNGNVSYRNKKVSINTSVGIAASKLKGTSYSHRQNIYADSTNYFNTDGRSDNKNARPNIRFQVDYDATKQLQMSMVVQANGNYFDNNGFTEYSNINRYNALYKLSNRSSGTNGNNINFNLQPSIVWKGKKPGEILRVITGFAYGRNNNNRAYFQQFLFPDTRLATGIDSTQNQEGRNSVLSYSLRANYDRPMKIKGWSFSTGATWNGNNNHNVVTTSFLKKPDNVLVPNGLLSSDFRFVQNILTVRAGLTALLSTRLRIIANLQAEETDFAFTYKTNFTNSNNNYWNILPSLTLRQDFKNNNNVSLVYRESIRRPGIGELNPAIDYNDPYNLRFGNPTLNPSVAHNFDLNYTLSKGKYYVNGSVGYNNVKDIFNTIRTLQADGKTYVTYQNIDNRQEFEASLWGGYTFSKSFRLNASTGYSFNKYGEQQKLLYKYRDGGSFYTSVNYNVLFSNVFTMDGNFRFSSFADPQGRSRSNVTMNFGVQHKFINRRLVLGVQVANPFHTSQLRTYTYGSNFALESYNSTNTKNYRFTISWQLNKNSTPKKPAGKKIDQKTLNKMMKM
ncbi:MAG: outer membrane beta-barrel protein [Chitinophagaceae bacterium]